ncbi:type I-D CRISPR-associated protein Cas10d/Csc3 [Haloferax volcanii]|uniref:type I-D CRISPR-associated protein Cas10d/Csc3 n=1 Tax=Haloferax volcanii TaxID=2246 RepID=UPI000677E83A|nr:type I-D CRISPR-associated protein Cas10d/Csc3 [Haloferax alexandrinus]
MSTPESIWGNRDTHPVLAQYLVDLDPYLLDIGWSFESAKSVEYSLTDQSMLNHVRNGVFAIVRLNDIAPSFGAHELSDDELRKVVALFTVHDLHKLRDKQGIDEEYDINVDEVATLVDALGVGSFAPDLRIETFHACAVDHANTWNSNPEHSTRTYDQLRPYVRLADAFASCQTPESATVERNQKGLEVAYPGTDLELQHHTLDDVKGVFTNLLSGAVSNVLKERFGYERLLIYQDGCVYLTSGYTEVTIDDELIGDVYDRLQSEIGDSHPAYDDHDALADNLSTQSQGFYTINDQDFFYAGARNLLYAVAVKAKQDADPDSDPTDSMAETMESLNEHLPIDIDATTRVAPGYARLVYTFKRAFVDPLVDAGLTDEDALTVTCRLFDVDGSVLDRLQETRDDENIDLTAGGKWDYAYAVGQHVADRARRDHWQDVPGEVAKLLITNLDALDEGWEDIVMDAHTGQFETEIRAYIGDTLRISGKASPPTAEMDELSDPFEEHHATRRGKTCTFCNRGTTSNRKSDMKAPKSLTTLQAGYSNRIPADAGQPEKLLVCTPCQIEFSLRETGSSRRDAGRIFVHLVPDYFYTPTMWDLYSDEIFARFTGEAMTRIGRLASAMFDIATADEDCDRRVETKISESVSTVLREATRAEDGGGRSMIEQLQNGFDPSAGFGSQTLSFYKPKDNETEFQFFGVFVGLAVASTMGLRAYVSQSPIPEVRGRDFSEMVRLDAGFTTVNEFYGREIPLSKLRTRLGAAAALIQLGYALARDDARFAKYLRTVRNKPLPGSYLLKRAVLDSDDGGTSRYLLEEADYLDRYGNLTNDADTTTAINK